MIIDSVISGHATSRIVLSFASACEHAYFARLGSRRGSNSFISIGQKRLVTMSRYFLDVSDCED
jgi:hypothetical protein